MSKVGGVGVAIGIQIGGTLGGGRGLILHLSGSQGLLVERGSNDLTVLENTSTSAKTCVDYLGVVQATLAGEIRLLGGRREDHSDGINYGWGALGIEWHNTEADGTTLITPVPVILHEPATSNLLTRSEEFDHADWGAILGITVTANNEIAPNGSLTADTLHIPLGGRYRQIKAFSSVVDGAMAIYVKAPASGAADSIALTTNNATAWNTGAVKKITLTTNWQLLFHEGALSDATDVIYHVGGAKLDGTNDPDVVGDVIVWGAQLQEGPLTQYIPTTTAAQSVLADLPRVPAVLDGNIRQDQIHMILRVKPQYASTATLEGLFSTSDTANSVISDSATINTISATDGTNTATRALAWVADDELHITFIASAEENIMVIGVIKNGAAQVWSANTTYDDAVVLASWLNYMFGNDNVVHILGHKIWKKLQGGITVAEAKTWSDANAETEMLLPGE